ncbi:tetratricopeptide repeat protein [Streptomyces sp. NPDC127098]|uniref:tetratricopeptide repeat protein n=1 Tax=Streptomyces sp. NPDC127098 TaxID=3347137 RepID=UPI00364DBDA0
MLVLVGSSSTGKTRACWEAVQPLADLGWRLWHPFDPTRADAALAGLHQVGPRTVVWLNEAQHYLGDPRVGEEIAAALHTLLTAPDRGPLLVLGTLWTEYADEYTVLPMAGAPDPHSRVRELLAGRTITIPETFDQEGLHRATTLAQGGDRLLADALTRAREHGRLTQDLAGAPELVRRYEQGTPAARAVLEAAMDARRLGMGLHLPQVFLIDAAIDYLSDHDLTDLSEDWAEAAFAELARRVYGKQAPLQRAVARPQRRPPGTVAPTSPSSPGTGPMFHLADFLEQHGRTTRRQLCPPASFWHAAHTHLSRPDDLNNLANAARTRYRLQWAHHLYLRAVDAGHPAAMLNLAYQKEATGDLEGAKVLTQRAADAGHPLAIVSLVRLLDEAGDHEGAKDLIQRAVDTGHPLTFNQNPEEIESAEDLYRRSVDTLNTLAQLMEKIGQRKLAEDQYRRAADAGHPLAMIGLARLLAKAGDQEGALNLTQRAVDTGHPLMLLGLALLRAKAGDRESANALYLQAVDTAGSDIIDGMAWLLEEAGDHERAGDLYRRAADAGSAKALLALARLQQGAGDRKRAQDLFRRVVDTGNPYAIFESVRLLDKAGDHEGAKDLIQRAVDTGNPDLLLAIAQVKMKVGDREGAEDSYRRAADAGSANALLALARLRERNGDQEGAEAFYRQLADAGHLIAPPVVGYVETVLGSLRLQTAPLGPFNAVVNMARLQKVTEKLAGMWPHGLDPDGTPTPPWQ